MKERPILFSAPMIRALLAGAKTQTRRLITPQPDHLQHHEWRGKLVYEGEHRMWCWKQHTFENLWDEHIREGDREAMAILCPYGRVGDRLWVKETWWCGRWTDEHFYNDADGFSRSSVNWRYHEPGDVETIAYVADGDPPDDRCEWWDKKPSIYLPRVDSRMTLEVAEVRVQRLQEITESDARAEGCHRNDAAVVYQEGVRGFDRDLSWTARGAYAVAWDRINAKRATWASNPWVWAITFSRGP